VRRKPCAAELMMRPNCRHRWYVGRSNSGYEAFQFHRDPTERDGLPYAYVVGPFRTKRAAMWAQRYGAGNPHFRHVNDAERIARHESQK
jgi:hypothetical protein